MHINVFEKLSSSKGKSARKLAFPVQITVEDRPLNSFIKGCDLVRKKKKINKKKATTLTPKQQPAATFSLMSAGLMH